MFSLYPGSPYPLPSPAARRSRLHPRRRSPLSNPSIHVKLLVGAALPLPSPAILPRRPKPPSSPPAAFAPRLRRSRVRGASSVHGRHRRVLGGARARARACAGEPGPLLYLPGRMGAFRGRRARCHGPDPANRRLGGAPRGRCRLRPTPRQVFLRLLGTSYSISGMLQFFTRYMLSLLSRCTTNSTIPLLCA